jgi:ribose transport system substrate-binding protein
MSINQHLPSWRTSTRATVVVLAASAATALAACGSSNDATGTAASSGSASTTATSSAAGQAAAAQYAARYIGKPSAFPATEPLKAAPKPGLKFVFMDCGTSVCGLIRALATPAVQAAGGKLIDVKVGTSASGINSGFNSVLQLKPDVIIDGGIDPALWKGALQKIKAAKIPIVSTGVAEDGRYGLSKYPNTNMYGTNAGLLAGKLVANYVYSKFGNKANVLVDAVPVIAATQVVSDAFVSEMKRLCPDCKVRQLTIQPQEMSTTAPAKIVSDLQAHPDTNIVVHGSDEAGQGLPAALKKAGLHQAVIGAIATPVSLQYVKAAQQQASVALDFPVMVWSMIDAGLRAVQSQPVSDLESQGIPPIQLLTPKDVTFDPSKGWSGYPDFAKRFTTLWKGDS